MVPPDSLLHSDGSAGVQANAFSADVLPIPVELDVRAGHDQASGVVQDLRTSLPLFIADVIGIASAVCLVELLGRALVGTKIDFALLPGVICAQLAVFLAFRLYPACGLRPYMEFRRIAQGCGCAALTLVLFHLSLFDFGSALRLAFYACLTLPLVSVFRAAVRRHCAGLDWWTQPVMVLGKSPRLERELRLHPELGMRPLRVADADEMAKYKTHRVIGSTDTLAQIPRGTSSHFRLIVELPEQLGGASVANYRSGAVELECVDQIAIPVVGFLKRCFDLACLLVTAPISLPIVCLLSMCVRCASQGTIFFGQKRVGRNGSVFYAWKFRTMVPNADEVLRDYLQSDPLLQEEWETTHKLRNDPRVTPIGRFLRSTSLDELPQLWNVLAGEMSLVGPRPIIDSPDYDGTYVRHYRSEFENYCRVRPGITGLWQVMGRNHTTYERRIQLDDFYVRNWSFFLDLYILQRTIRTVLLREGAY